MYIYQFLFDKIIKKNFLSTKYDNEMSSIDLKLIKHTQSIQENRLF